MILFDAAYEAFIQDPDPAPQHISRSPGRAPAPSKSAPCLKQRVFTGTRLGYTVIPKELETGGDEPAGNVGAQPHHQDKRRLLYHPVGAGLRFSPLKDRSRLNGISKSTRTNAACLMESPGPIGIWYCGGKNAPYIWMKCPGGLSSWDFFDLLLEKNPGGGDPGRGVWRLWGGFLSPVHLWKPRGYQGSGQTAVAAAGIIPLAQIKKPSQGFCLGTVFFIFPLHGLGTGDIQNRQGVAHGDLGRLAQVVYVYLFISPWSSTFTRQAL